MRVSAARATIPSPAPVIAAHPVGGGTLQPFALPGNIVVFHPPVNGGAAIKTHSTDEANADTVECFLDVNPGVLGYLVLWITGNEAPRVDIGTLLPEWKDVEDGRPAELAGTVVAIKGDEDYPFPAVSYNDMPISHYSHDFCFAVQPDPTPDRRYDRLLARTPQGAYAQQTIWVEWECGLGASNDDNPLQGDNTAGRSGGFYTAGHGRRDVIWNWPTLGDHVYVVGRWIWDRGHSPRTEIHPPRLVAIQRANPALVQTTAGIDPGPDLLTTRIDIFASGDGGALTNNRRGVPGFVQRVPMNDRNYTFIASHPVPAPTGTASPPQLTFWEFKHPGDTFPGPLQIKNVTLTPAQGGAGQLALDVIPEVSVTVPWRTRRAPADAVLARTVYLAWNQGTGGVAGGYGARRYTVTLTDVRVNASEDYGDGEYRVFAAVDADYLFLNELPRDGNILDGGLGDTGDNQTWGIGKTFDVVVPPGGAFRVHAGGWEADGVNDLFGKLVDPAPRCDQATKDWFNDNLFNFGVASSGGLDDPIGQINDVWRLDPATLTLHLDGNPGIPGAGTHLTDSTGPVASDISDTNPDKAFTLHYKIKLNPQHPW
jgi:hypothetical protein